MEKQRDWTGLEKYFNKNPKNIDIIYKTYNPDIIEWKDNLQSK